MAYKFRYPILKYHRCFLRAIILLLFLRSLEASGAPKNLQGIMSSKVLSKKNRGIAILRNVFPKHKTQNQKGLPQEIQVSTEPEKIAEFPNFKFNNKWWGELFPEERNSQGSLQKDSVTGTEAAEIEIKEQRRKKLVQATKFKMDRFRGLMPIFAAWAKSTFTRRFAKKAGMALGLLLISVRAVRIMKKLPALLQHKGWPLDLDIDAADRHYKDSGGILQLQAYPIIKSLDIDEGSTVSLKYILEMKCNKGSRESFVTELAGVMHGIAEQLSDRVVADQVISKNSRAWKEGIAILQVRVVDAALRVARDSLLRSCREVEDLLLFWKSVHKRSKMKSWYLKRLDILPSRVHKSFDQLQKKESDIITGIELYLESMTRKLGRIQRILLEQPVWISGKSAPESLVLWAEESLKEGRKLMIPMKPISHVEDPIQEKAKIKDLFYSNSTDNRYNNMESDKADVLGLKDLSTQSCELVTISRDYRSTMARTMKELGASRPLWTTYWKKGIIVAIIPVTAKGALAVYKNWGDICLLSFAAWEGTKSFFYKQAYIPLKNVVGAVIFRRNTDIFDDGALIDAQSSLEKLLDDFARDTQPSLSKEERQRRAKEMDMSLVSPVYEKEIAQAVRNILSGKIVRMLLIQVQFIKKELLVAMQAIDELFNANQVNLQIIAIIPAVLIGGLILAIVRNSWYAITSQGFKSTAMVNAYLRSLLREMERILTLSNRLQESALMIQEKTKEISQKATEDALQIQDTMNIPGVQLGPEETGKLVLLLFRFRLLLQLNYQRFHNSVRSQLEHDLEDLVRGQVTISQQLSTIQRMRNTYSIFKVASSNIFSDLGVI